MAAGPPISALMGQGTPGFQFSIENMQICVRKLNSPTDMLTFSTRRLILVLTGIDELSIEHVRPHAVPRDYQHGWNHLQELLIF